MSRSASTGAGRGDPSSLGLRVAQSGEPLANLGHLWLQLGIGVLPQLDELGVVAGRLLPLTLGFVELTEPFEHRRAVASVDLDSGENRGGEEALVDGNR